MIQINWQQAGRLTGKDPGELQTMFTDENGEVSPTAPDEIIKLAGLKVKDHGSQQFSRARKEAWTSMENFIREKGFSGEDLEGMDLLTAFVDSLPLKDGKTPAAQPTEITQDFLEKNDVARTWLDEKVRKFKGERDALKAELEVKVTEFTQAQVWSAAEKQAFDFLEAAGWDSGKDKGEDVYLKRKQAMSLLLQPYKGRMKLEGDQVHILDENGYPAKDEDANPVTFQDLVLKVNPFGTAQKAQSSGTPGARTQPPSGTQPPQGLVIKDKAHYNLLWDEANKIQDPKEKSTKKAEISRAYGDFLTQAQE